ncbi:MAG: glycosyltransferase family 8 protein [Puniceicoccales bacterium]|jgi:lipopolysaccharide biosynthesis glycosyltransferase|nr:glycosyltransferase family 8 protein [Puniceicoccales bacterium]
MVETVNIAFAFDDKFTGLFLVAASSIAKNTASTLVVHIVNCGIAEENIKRIYQLNEMCENISEIKISMPERVDVLEKLPTEERFNSSVFYRLAIHKVFSDLERVIYLDCDIVANGDILELWHEDLGGRPFGAVEEDGNLSDEKTRLYKQSVLELSKEKFYYNSGVLLIDCEKFKESKIFERVIEYVGNTKIFLSCPEQDAMNACLEQDEHLPLSPKYNFIPFATLARECLKKIGKPILIEYACVKPWQMDRGTVKFFHSLKMFPYATTMLMEFWAYADTIDSGGFDGKNIFSTLKFFLKCATQPVEIFIKKCCSAIKSGQKRNDK